MPRVSLERSAKKRGRLSTPRTRASNGSAEPYMNDSQDEHTGKEQDYVRFYDTSESKHETSKQEFDKDQDFKFTFKPHDHQYLAPDQAFKPVSPFIAKSEASFRVLKQWNSSLLYDDDIQDESSKEETNDNDSIASSSSEEDQFLVKMRSKRAKSQRAFNLNAYLGSESDDESNKENNALLANSSVNTQIMSKGATISNPKKPESLNVTNPVACKKFSNDNQKQNVRTMRYIKRSEVVYRSDKHPETPILRDNLDFEPSTADTENCISPSPKLLIETNGSTPMSILRLNKAPKTNEKRVNFQAGTKRGGTNKIKPRSNAKGQPTAIKKVATRKPMSNRTYNQPNMREAAVAIATPSPATLRTQPEVFETASRSDQFRKLVCQINRAVALDKRVVTGDQIQTISGRDFIRESHSFLEECIRRGISPSYLSMPLLSNTSTGRSQLMATTVALTPTNQCQGISKNFYDSTCNSVQLVPPIMPALNLPLESECLTAPASWGLYTSFGTSYLQAECYEA